MVAAVILAPAVATADAPDAALVIKLQNGVEEVYFLNETPRITYSDTKMAVSTTQVSAEHEMADVERAYFDMRTPGSGIQTDGISPFTFRFDGTNVVVTGLRPGEEVTLYDLRGVAKMIWEADADGRCAFPVEDFSGIYILKTSLKAIKLTL